MKTRDETVAELRRVIEDYLKSEKEGVREVTVIDLLETTGKILLPLCHVKVDGTSIYGGIG